jgi:alpha-L-fucosidase 2
MLEALVQSRWTPVAIEIELLPALPQQWSEGSVQGLRVRGGASVDMRWKNSRVTSIELHATSNAAMRIIPPAGQAIAHVVTAAGQTVPLGANAVVRFRSGTSYHVAFR